MQKELKSVSLSLSLLISVSTTTPPNLNNFCSNCFRVREIVGSKKLSSQRSVELWLILSGNLSPISETPVLFVCFVSSMSRSCYKNESNNVMKERKVAPFSSAIDFQAVQPLRGSRSSSPIDETIENQLVLYGAKGNDTEEEVQQSQLPSCRTQCPSIGAFTVQCACCFKWRLMPSMQKYEEIREKLLENPFFCEMACEWKPNMSCDVPADISQDGTRLWAIDKPSIARPPTGWQRLLRIRGEGGTKFADVYYVTPSGKKLRSNVEVQKYLNEHPEYVSEGLKLSQFSFQIPKPLQDNYVRKRPTRVVESSDNTNTSVATEANPLTWISPEDQIASQLGKRPEPRLNDSPSKKIRTSGSHDDLARQD
ncbi:unnamed protein product [Thlaspi arvense]|uniref:Methyl-CpG-binding domain-containing protein 2 n=1 Tax=Thlaspi arvense TaxID=13288 RepID=A0AAU9T5G1_THLAR|nr:unnamed protein product [Thlaspi arvense]